jgi:hypothetical protein
VKVRHRFPRDQSLDDDMPDITGFKRDQARSDNVEWPLNTSSLQAVRPR